MSTNALAHPKVIAVDRALIIGLVALLAVVVAACEVAPAPSEAALAAPMLKPGDMTLAAGRLNTGLPAVSIWDFCQPDLGSADATIRECHVPLYPQMIVGGQWTASDADWSAMTWELYIDDQPVDLAAFGTWDDEVRGSRMRGWNVLLANLSSGSQHTLRHVLRLSQPVGDFQAGTYELVIELIADDQIGSRRVVK